MKKLLYNTTFLVDFSIESVWEEWMISDFIPIALSSEGIESFKFLKILSDDEQQGASYALQFTVNSLDDLLSYQSGLKKQLHFNLKTKWGEACLNFSTLMEICDEG